MGLVGYARRQSGLMPPVMSGDPTLERAVRIQANTVEQGWLPTASYGFASLYAAGVTLVPVLGLASVICRAWYAVGYWRTVKGRGMGFMLALLLVGVWG